MQHQNKAKGKYAILFASVLAITTHFSTAADGSWFINPTIGYQWFDSDRNLDDDGLIGLGVEHHFNDAWGFELKYLDSDPDGENGGVNADLRQMMLEGMYMPGNYTHLQPYMALGVGHAKFDYDGVGSDKETQATIGLGARYWLSERWSTKADVRMVRGIDDGDNDRLLTLAISYAFGKAATPEPATEITRSLDPEPPREKDSDGDGVLDKMDRCPNTPYGIAVDSRGCAQKLIENKTISLDVKFVSNDHQIADHHLVEIEKVARFMEQYPTVKGVVEGHTDDVGSASYNEQLSQKRADAVRRVLIEQFEVDPERLSAVGHGEERPIADNATDAGRQLNRRVQAVFTAEVTTLKKAK